MAKNTITYAPKVGDYVFVSMPLATTHGTIVSLDSPLVTIRNKWGREESCDAKHAHHVINGQINFVISGASELIDRQEEVFDAIKTGFRVFVGSKRGGAYALFNAIRWFNGESIKVHELDQAPCVWRAFFRKNMPAELRNR